MAVLVAAMWVGTASAQVRPGAGKMMVSKATTDGIIARWTTRPRLGAVEMIAKYGAPQEATPMTLVWHDAGPFKRIMVMNIETPHDFPLPHVDFMEHTISYMVPLDKVGALIEFDGSSTINRTVGELSARCDLEGHNVLTLNLDHDIVMGTKTVQQARMAFGEIVGQDVKGQHPAYVEALQFQPATMMAAAFPDDPVIPGSPVRAARAGATSMMMEGEILASVIALDLNEVLAAGQAGMKKLSAPVMAYAKMLHEEHGMHMEATMKLGQQLGATPVITPAVEAMQKKGAGELATLVPLNGMAFERAYLAAMAKGHTEALAMLDMQIAKAGGNAALKAHLASTRTAVAAHHAKAHELQAGMRK